MVLDWHADPWGDAAVWYADRFGTGWCRQCLGLWIDEEGDDDDGGDDGEGFEPEADADAEFRDWMREEFGDGVEIAE